MIGEWSFKFESGVVGSWPENGFGEPERPAFLEHIFGSEPELMLERNMLLSFGIPSVARYPNNGDLGKVVLGMSGTGLDIFVPESMLEDAKNIISSPDDIPEDGGPGEDPSSGIINNNLNDNLNEEE